jgi:hypothetical protein
MRCERCREPVRSEVLPDGVRRRYGCACQQKDVAWSYQIGGESDDLYPEFTGWVCEGHPDLLLPATLDGVRMDADTRWDTAAADAILRPPFQPPGVDLHVVWLVRLYRLLGAERPLLSKAVAGLLDAKDPRLVRGALDFFLTERSAPGVERITDVLTERRRWLSATPDPRYPSCSLLHTAADLLYERLLDAAHARVPADRRALEVSEELALAGIGPTDAPLAFSSHDPKWLWAHAESLIRANEGWVGMMVYATVRASAARRKRVLQDIAVIAPERVRKAIEQHIGEPERGVLLASIRT